ncbi:MAG: hypothetical protein KJO13_08840, partial [Gammaproteobacteria bacterium]|nr:hypothetical protein [Gammaproteobacteria bacterium]
MQEAGVKAILYAFLANFGIALAKTWGVWFTGSGSMFAEAVTPTRAPAIRCCCISVSCSQRSRPTRSIRMRPDLTLDQAVEHINL